MSVRPVNYDIYIEIGRDFTQTFYIQDSGGTAVDLTGWAVQAQLRPTFQSTVLLADFSTVVSGTAGSIELSLTDTQTAELELSTPIDLSSSVSSTNAVYDVMLTDLLDKSYNYIKGTATIEGTSTVKP